MELIIEQARRILEGMDTTTLHEVRVPVIKPTSLIAYDVDSLDRFEPNFHVVVFNKFRKTDGSMVWVYSRIE